MQTNTNNVNKTRAPLQTTGGKDEPNIVLMRKDTIDIQIRIALHMYSVYDFSQDD